MVTAEIAISIDETARRLGISRKSAYAAVRRGEIPTLRFGRRRVVPIAALDALARSAYSGNKSAQANGNG